MLNLSQMEITLLHQLTANLPLDGDYPTTPPLPIYLSIKITPLSPPSANLPPDGDYHTSPERLLLIIPDGDYPTTPDRSLTN